MRAKGLDVWNQIKKPGMTDEEFKVARDLHAAKSEKILLSEL